MPFCHPHCFYHRLSHRHPAFIMTGDPQPIFFPSTQSVLHAAARVVFIKCEPGHDILLPEILQPSPCISFRVKLVFSSCLFYNWSSCPPFSLTASPATPCLSHSAPMTLDSLMIPEHTRCIPTFILCLHICYSPYIYLSPTFPCHTVSLLSNFYSDGIFLERTSLIMCSKTVPCHSFFFLYSFIFLITSWHIKHTYTQTYNYTKAETFCSVLHPSA